jgi:hypothetical protein
MLLKKTQGGASHPFSFLMLQQMLQEKHKGRHRDLPSFSCYNKLCEKKHNGGDYGPSCPPIPFNATKKNTRGASHPSPPLLLHVIANAMEKNTRGAL